MKNKILWTPSKEIIDNSHLQKFKNIINNKYHLTLHDYSDIYKWSVDNIDDFWEELWGYSKIIYSKNFSRVRLNGNRMIDTKWFLDSKLNYAENLLRYKNNDVAIYFFGEDEIYRTLTFNELYKEVAKVAHTLKSLGIKKGDRVAAYIPNIPESVIGMLAATSIGAIWSSCSPDFGIKGVLDRFSQIKPKIIFAADGYYYKGKAINSKEKLEVIIDSLSSVQSVIIADYINNGDSNWNEIIIDEIKDLDFEQLDFHDPLYIMYSSGTTGKPKSIVHSVGGTLIQHYKEHLLHVDLNYNNKIFYFTTCGWMMWNWLVSCLSLGTSIVLFDGNPFYPKKDSLLEKMSQIDIDIFGTSAKYISTLESLNAIPSKFSFKSLRTILSTGSPLLDNNFDFVYKYWKKDIQLSSISGGTDIVSCFALGSPISPVYRGELQCVGLGMSVKSYSEKMQHEINSKGELVCDKPFPSMPVKFWDDEDNSKYLSSYFLNNNNLWQHGDFIKINNHGGVIIYGRSDATLNPGGVRIGTSEIYKAVESYKVVQDSLVIGQIFNGDERIILFIKLIDNVSLENDYKEKIKRIIKEHCSPRHVPDKIVIVNEIPYTINGKKVEIAVKNIFNNNKVLNKDSLANPSCLDEYLKIASTIQ